jgi:hypothetical protein
MAETTTSSPAPASNWYDPLVNLALKGAEIYGKVVEVKSASKPNNVTVLRAEDIHPATGKPYGVTPTGSAGVTTSTTPAWLLPVAIGGGVLVLLLAVLGLRRR